MQVDQYFSKIFAKKAVPTNNTYTETFSAGHIVVDMSPFLLIGEFDDFCHPRGGNEARDQ